tara:strand:- start:3581 stop:3958 length:378 start_codon:yes stop_codon:yes gene_type:complete
MENGVVTLERYWKNFRIFSYRNRTLVEFFFIGIYGFEQLMLVGFTFFWPELLMLIITNYSIILLTTFALNKLVMESRIRILENNITNISKKYDILKILFDLGLDRKEKTKITKDLNRYKTQKEMR